MLISEDNQREYFLPDDYDRINNKYFKKLRNSGNIEADPSFWFDSISPAEDIFPSSHINKYRSDYQNGLKEEKDVFINCINQWDLQSFDYNEITICSSVTTASFITLLFLQSRNVNDIFFETPAYFACIGQAKSLKMNVFLIPTYFENQFQMTDKFLSSFNNHRHSKAIWITQPRFGLGTNQSLEKIIEIIKHLNKDDFIIIDEATEQLFPTLIRDINFGYFKNVIKLRSFFKSSGLNGPRISFILHHKEYRELIQNYLEIAQGAIDCFSLEFAKTHLQNIEFFKSILLAANIYVNSLRRKVESFSRGTNIISIPLENGYIGSIAVTLSRIKNYYREREGLLHHCARCKVPVILGSTMRFPKDVLYEFIRMNYFNTEYSILRGIEQISKFSG
jgi:histidinol-phosphate/aromatic aminotransferase/cobyric acid decarboxylase-like protein